MSVVNPTPMCIRALVYVGITLYSIGCVLKEKEKHKRWDGNVLVGRGRVECVKRVGVFKTLHIHVSISQSIY